MACNDDTEILIHITAPGLAADDRRYRAITAAYLDFQPTKRTKIVNHTGQSSKSQERLEVGVDKAPSRREKQPELFSQIVGVPTFIQSPSLSFDTVSISTNVARQFRPDKQRILQEESGLEFIRFAPQGVAEDSLLEKNIPIPLLNSSTKINKFVSNMIPESNLFIPSSPSYLSPSPGLQNLRKREFNPSVQVKVPNSLPANQYAEPPGFDKKTRVPQNSFTPELAEGSFQMSETSINSFSGIPEVQSSITIAQVPINSRNKPAPSLAITSAVTITNPALQEAKSESEASIISENFFSPSTNGTNISFNSIKHKINGLFVRGDSEPTPKHLKLDITSLFEKRRFGRTQNNLSVKTPRARIPSMALFEIHSPFPAVSVTPLSEDSLLSPGLLKLARDLDITRCFGRQRRALRKLRPFERGYWCVTTDKWDFSEKKTAWQFLRNFVSSGYAGWGVRCLRDEGFTFIKVFCFGRIVSHVYLILYLASCKKILQSGCMWCDAVGKPTVVIPRQRGKSMVKR